MLGLVNTPNGKAPLELRDLPEPQPARKEALVHLRVATIVPRLSRASGTGQDLRFALFLLGQDPIPTSRRRFRFAATEHRGSTYGFLLIQSIGQSSLPPPTVKVGAIPTPTMDWPVKSSCSRLPNIGDGP